MDDEKNIKKNILISLLIATLFYIIFYLINIYLGELIKLNTILDFVLLYIYAVVTITLLFFSVIYLLLAKDYFKDLKK